MVICLFVIQGWFDGITMFSYLNLGQFVSGRSTKLSWDVSVTVFVSVSFFCSVHIQFSFGIYENQRQGSSVPCCIVEDTWPAGRGRSATAALPLYVCTELFALGHGSQFCAMLKEMSKTGHKSRNLLTFQIVLWQKISQTFNLWM